MDSLLSKSDLLILGSSSKIGKVLSEGIPHRSLVKFTRNPENESIHKLLFNKKNNYPKTDCGFAIVLSAITSIQACEEEPNSTKEVNVNWVIKQIRELAELGWSVIYVSSDAVFDGTKKFPIESDKPCPVLEYGKQKVEVEEFVKRLDPNNHRILRLTKILDWGTDPWKTLTLKKELNPKPIFANKKFSPLSKKSMINQLKLAISIEQPIVHISPHFLCSYLDFAEYLNRKLWGKDLNISYALAPQNGGLGTSIPSMQNLKSKALEIEANMFLREKI